MVSTRHICPESSGPYGEFPDNGALQKCDFRNLGTGKDHGCSMRIGVNAGSLEKDLLEKYGEPCPEAMVESALNHAKILEDNDFFEFKISCKASDVFLAVAAYQQLAEACD